MKENELGDALAQATLFRAQDHLKHFISKGGIALALIRLMRLF